MDTRRASAYTGVIHTLDELADAIPPADQDTIREAADARLFARGPGIASERSLRAGLDVLDRLAGEGQISPWAADQIEHDLAACGPHATRVAVSR